MNILGIDFEDWYHPELIAKSLTNEKKIPKVVAGIDKIIDFLRINDTTATFFVVGELLQYKPELLDKIIGNEHEIGFHTMHHNRLDIDNSKEKFSEELKNFSLLTNNKCHGFRAPTFSLNQKSSWVIDSLEEHGYIYDSSVVPAKSTMYGIPNAPTHPYKISNNSIDKETSTGKLVEFPIMVTRFLGKKIPAGGGFYLRSLPLKIIKNAIKKYEQEGIPATFYIHSWELTPELMPRIKLPKKDYFITYHKLDRAKQKMQSLLESFNFTSVDNYIKNFN
jgi:polysaccharide deacetylase family protein (PEP-CTERM system associated)